tara:strand:+ start:55 stop:540 length:486 start_codon:yes stop_codon:yes gene_type:complete
MEFVLHGVKFNYEYNNIYQLYEYKKGHEWKERKLSINNKGYKCFEFMVNRKRYYLLLHRIVYWIHNPDWDILDSSILNNSIDHIDGNPLNNNIENLRVVTHQENQWNRTRAKGYTWNKTAKKWEAYIKYNNKRKYLGVFDNEIEAHNAYLDAKKKYYIIRS